MVTVVLSLSRETLFVQLFIVFRKIIINGTTCLLLPNNKAVLIKTVFLVGRAALRTLEDSGGRNAIFDVFAVLAEGALVVFMLGGGPLS